jgi:hypothetical protein
MLDRKLIEDDSRGRLPILPCLLLGWIAVLCAGCGTTRTRMATEQLLISDAVDRSVAQIDFSPLRGKQVFFDTRYITSVKGNHFVNADYVISSLRQQMLAAGCLLEDKMETAEYIIEGRCGALGTDGHEITYGIPASSGLSNAASIVPGVPSVPLIPEISVARREDNRAAAKIGVFAYHRESRMPVWQAGVVVSTSNAKDIWLFGAGPFQTGTIYDGTQFAGNRLRMPLAHEDEEPSSPSTVSYYDEFDFERERRIAERRRRQTLEAIHQMGEIPELMPISQLVFENSVGPRRLPPVELEIGADEPVIVASKPEDPKPSEEQTPAESPDSSEAAGASEPDAADPSP